MARLLVTAERMILAFGTLNLLLYGRDEGISDPHAWEVSVHMPLGIAILDMDECKTQKWAASRLVDVTSVLITHQCI